MDRLDERRLRSLLAGEAFVTRLVVLDRTGSTNDDARRLAAEGASEGTVVIAGEQTRGRGRLGRSWHSSRGLGVYVSVLLRPRVAIAELTRWTVAASVAACEACHELSYPEVRIKWPNDLTASGRKVAGTLVEVRSAGPGASELVVGTGFNVSHRDRDFPTELRSRAASLRSIGAERVPGRERLAAAYLLRLAGIHRELLDGGWDGVASRWSSRSVTAGGSRIRVAPGNGGPGAFEGTSLGLDPRGALRVRRDDGSVTSVHLGESVTAVEDGPCF